ncbi:proton-coupled zinc antiporter SLC30A8 [Rhineura floridana]|uniref:proton-coupled zinc antiporter SLC30A8 n=1 Tax=Rhineura floridana TaxID=261503 RepID=UPI002AC84D9C|nr:proton-coupled zinc antiporter SLC30A8 [Rhineura floridana]
MTQPSFGINLPIMTTMKKSLERTCLVNNRDAKRYTVNLSSIDLQKKNSYQENHQEKLAYAGPVSRYHCHNHSEAYEIRKGEQHQAKQKLYVASVICLIFMIAEIVGGHIAGSLAVITDASHVLVDLMSFLISIFSLWLSSKPSSKTLTYGWHRAEILGAFLSAIVIWVVTGILIFLAIMRLLHPQYEIETTVMLITSVCAVIANLILSLTLHPTGHKHLHHAHGAHHRKSSDAEQLLANASVRAAFIHAIGDLFQSLSVLISALIIFFKPEYKIADPICTFIFSIFILMTTITILRDILLVLMEGTPRGLTYDAVKERILAVDKVESVHSLHLWSLTMNQIILSAHIVTGDTPEKQQVLNKITEVLFDTYHFYAVTLQIEAKADQKPDCVFCQDPTE